MPARVDYGGRRFTEEGLPRSPVRVFQEWLVEARDADVAEANAFCLCTSADGYGHGRFLLLKGVDESGFRFFTNYGSSKAQQLAESRGATMVFWWGALRRQVRVTGPVARLSPAASDEYFASRPRESQLAAWASVQSSLVPNREALEQRLEEVTARFVESEAVPRPEFWGGFQLRPERVEFWQGRSNRFHDRIVYTEGTDGWQISRLMP